MKNLLIAFIFLLAFKIQAAEVKINCDVLAGSAACTMAQQNTNFMTINKKPLYFVHGSKCTQSNCDWVAQASPYFLKEGNNEAHFQVTTVTNDENIYADHLYRFFFAGVFKDQLRSQRRGTEFHRATRYIYLTLQEIDPALYNEYLELKSHYDDSYGDNSIDRRLKELSRERAEINKRIRELENLLSQIQGKNFDEIDADTLARLGIGEGQLRLLTIRRDQLDQFEKEIERGYLNQQTQLAQKYEVLRARARTYHSTLPDIPSRPKNSSDDSDSISPLVEELNASLVQIITSFEKAITAESLELYRKALHKWKDKSEFVISLYTESNDLNNAEKELLYLTVLNGSQILYKSGVTKDMWTKVNDIQPSTREVLDNLADKYSEASELRNTLNFKKIPSENIAKVNESLLKVEKLANKIESFRPSNDQDKDALKIAKASLATGLESINSAVTNQKENELEAANKTLDVGTIVLDIGLDMLPVVGTARSALELFTGKNIVTGDKLSDAEYSLAFVGLFVGLSGFNVAKVALAPAMDIYWKISKKASNIYQLNVDSIKVFPQVETLIHEYQKLKRPIIAVTDSKTVNNLLKLKYPRFKDPAFAGSRVITRTTEAGEEFCRVFWRTSEENNKIPTKGGIFVFRCVDIIKKNLETILKMASIHSSPDNAKYYIGKIAPPTGTRTYEGVASSLNGKPGGAIQILLDIDEKEVLHNLTEHSPEIPLAETFIGF